MTMITRITTRGRSFLSPPIIASLLLGLWALCGGGRLAHAQAVCVTTCPTGATCADYTTWATGASTIISGHNPHGTQDDVSGLTNQVSAPAMVTSMENTCGGVCGLLYWNPSTNAFKTFCVTGGFQFALDINRSTTLSLGPPAFGGGDVWATVHSNGGFSPYVNFRGSGSFRRWNVGAPSATGIRVNPANGKVYLGNFGDAGGAIGIIELDPATNAVRKFLTGNRPYALFFDGAFVWATAVAGGELPDQILRLDPTASTSNLTRWTVPAGSAFQSSVSGNPNFITKDLEGKAWFTLTATNQVGRLDPLSTPNTITTYTKTGISGPQNIASSGTGTTLQAFFTEASGQAVSVLTPSISTIGATSAVTPTVSTVTPLTSSATPVDFTPEMRTSAITPSACKVVGVDPNGIIRFPAPPGTTFPTGMTRVALPQTVFGSLEGSHHVFQLKSAAIIAPPPGQGVVQTLSLTPANNSGTVFNDNNSNATSITLNGLTENAIVTIDFRLVSRSEGSLTTETGTLPCIIVSSDGTKCAIQQIDANTTAYKSAHIYWGWRRKGTKNPHLFRFDKDITAGQYIEPGICGDTFPLSPYRAIELPLPTGAINCGFFRPVADGAVFNLGRTIPFRFEATTSTCRGGPFITAASGAQPRLSLAKVVPGFPPVPQPVMPSGASNVSNLFRIGDGRVWMYNASTKHLTAGDYIVTVFDLTNHIPPASVRISLR